VQVKASDIAQVGTAVIGVRNPAPGGGDSNSVYFPVQLPAASLGVGPVAGVTGSPYEVSGDFNNDGKFDLVSAGNLSVNLYAGNGDGTFAAPFPKLSEVPVGHMVAADFNNDGKLDLLVTGVRPAVYLGNGDGTFGPHLFFTNFGEGGFGMPAVGDFNGDGKLDVALLDFDSIQILLGNGDGTFRAATQYSVVSHSSSVATADFNGDGILDLVTDGGTVLLGNGDGTFTAGTTVTTNGAGGIAVADFNGDGKLDFAVGGIDVLLGNGDGTFQPPILIARDSLGAIGDFNNDGKLDFAGNLVYLQVPIMFSPLSLDFGTQKVGTQSAPQTVAATNVGASILTLTGISFTGDDPQDFTQNNDCGTSIQVGGQCHIKIVFQPQAGGNRSASLSVGYQGFGSPQGIPVAGFGTLAIVTLTPASLTFSLQLDGTTSHPQTATLTNRGTASVNISNIGTSAQFTQTNNCPSSLAVGAHCLIQVAFAPKQKGHISGTLSVTDDAQGSPQTVVLSGVATEVKVSTKGVNFGNQKVGTKSAPAPVKLTNTGLVPFTVTQVSIQGKDPEDFSQTNNCHKVFPGGSCTIKVTFAPTATGQRTATLQISDNGGGSPQKIAFNGNGT
jgi:hypothetical protein